MPDLNGYPTDSELERIRRWPIKNTADCKPLLEFVKFIWWNPEWGVIQEDNDWHFSTGGWSGNEEIIGILEEKPEFWGRVWESTRRGGHYIFRLRKETAHDF